MIPRDLDKRVVQLRDEFCSLLDTDTCIDGELRVKLAKAELVLNKIAKLLKEKVDSSE
jgi:hypothetical protein